MQDWRAVNTWIHRKRDQGHLEQRSTYHVRLIGKSSHNSFFHSNKETMLLQNMNKTIASSIRGNQNRRLWGKLPIHAKFVLFNHPKFANQLPVQFPFQKTYSTLASSKAPKRSHMSLNVEDNRHKQSWTKDKMVNKTSVGYISSIYI